MPHRFFPIVAMLAFCLAPTGLFADEVDQKKLLAELTAVAEAQMKAIAEHDTEAMANTFHAESPARESTKQLMERFLKPFKLTHKIESFKYVGIDDDFVYVRIKYLTKKLAGPAFRDNVSDSLFVYRKEGAAWKLWSSAVLGTTFVDP